MDEQMVVNARRLMWGILLALLATICWGLAPVAAKMALNHVSPVVGLTIRSLIATCLVSAWLVATGHYRWIGQLNTRTTLWLLAEALLATVVGDAFYFYALRHGEAGQVSLIMASAPVITLASAFLLLHEPITAAKVIGAALVILGVLLIGI
jgi:transporter family protein